MIEVWSGVLGYTRELSSLETPLALYYLLVAVESLQLVGYAHHDPADYSSLGVMVPRFVSRQLNLDYYLANTSLTLVATPLLFLLTLSHALLIFFSFRAYLNKKRSVYTNRGSFGVHILTILYLTVLTIPCFQVSLSAIICVPGLPYSQALQCYDTTHICLLAMAIANLIWLLLITVYFSLYYYSCNSFLTVLTATNSNQHHIGRFLLKITPMLYLFIDPTLLNTVLYLIALSSLNLLYLLLFRYMFPYYLHHARTDSIVFGFEIATTSVILYYPVSYLLPTSVPDILFIAAVFMAVVAGLLASKFMLECKSKLAGRLHEKEKDAHGDILEYIVYCIYCTQLSVTPKPSFLAIMFQHAEACQNTHCCCHTIKSKADISSMYEILLCVIDRVIAEHKNSFQFSVIKASICCYRLKSWTKASSLLAQMLKQKLSHCDEMVVRGLLQELQIKYNDTRDMEKYRRFAEQLRLQEQECLRISDCFSCYWQELIDQNSSVVKLYSILSEIKASRTVLASIVASALSIYPKHVQVLLLYKELLRDVLRDRLSYAHCEQQFRQGLSMYETTAVDAADTIQFRPNEDLVVIHTTRKDDWFEIVTITTNVTRFLGHAPSELRGKNINRLIPRLYHSYHDSLIRHSLDLADSEIVHRQIAIYPLDTSNHMVPCNLMNKFMPSLQEGLSIVSFIELCEMEQALLLYDRDTGVIDCMTGLAQQIVYEGTVVGGTRNLLNGIPNHVKELLPDWDIVNETMHRVGGLVRQSRKIVLQQTAGTNRNVKMLRIILEKCRDHQQESLKIEDIKPIEIIPLQEPEQQPEPVRVGREADYQERKLIGAVTACYLLALFVLLGMQIRTTQKEFSLHYGLYLHAIAARQAFSQIDKVYCSHLADPSLALKQSLSHYNGLLSQAIPLLSGYDHPIQLYQFTGDSLLHTASLTASAYQFNSYASQVIDAGSSSSTFFVLTNGISPLPQSYAQISRTLLEATISGLWEEYHEIVGLGVSVWVVLMGGSILVFVLLSRRYHHYAQVFRQFEAISISSLTSLLSPCQKYSEMLQKRADDLFTQRKSAFEAEQHQIQRGGISLSKSKTNGFEEEEEEEQGLQEKVSFAQPPSPSRQLLRMGATAIVLSLLFVGLLTYVGLSVQSMSSELRLVNTYQQVVSTLVETTYLTCQLPNSAFWAGNPLGYGAVTAYLTGGLDYLQEHIAQACATNQSGLQAVLEQVRYQQGTPNRTQVSLLITTLSNITAVVSDFTGGQVQTAWSARATMLLGYRLFLVAIIFFLLFSFRDLRAIYHQEEWQQQIVQEMKGTLHGVVDSVIVM